MLRYVGVTASNPATAPDDYHASETTTSRATHQPETKGQLLRVAAAALRLHPAALASDLGAAARGKHVLRLLERAARDEPGRTPDHVQDRLARLRAGQAAAGPIRGRRIVRRLSKGVSAVRARGASSMPPCHVHSLPLRETLLRDCRMRASTTYAL